MNSTPNAERLRIVLLGMRNAGKSSLMNRLFDREVSIISTTPGTTTDPVTRAMELGPLGPVMLTDTAGLDDEGELGEQRIDQSLKRASSADAILFVTPAHLPPAPQEVELLRKLQGNGDRDGNGDGRTRAAAALPLRIVLTFADRPANPQKTAWIEQHRDLAAPVRIDNSSGQGVQAVLESLHSLRPALQPEISPLEGLVSAGDIILLVTPIDSAAPKGRLILPQVETLRDALDRDCAALVAKENELPGFYAALKARPKLVITDSQAFHQVAAALPPDQPLTSFSILFARKKGDLAQFIRGLQHMHAVPPDGRVLVLESCSHHRQADDIGTVKIPRLFRAHVQPEVEFSFARSLPPEDEVRSYDLIIHCAACMNTRRFVTARLAQFERLGIPVTNYGLFLGWVNGLIPRALEPLHVQAAGAAGAEPNPPE